MSTTANPVLAHIEGDIARIKKAPDFQAREYYVASALSSAINYATGYYDGGAIPTVVLAEARDAITAAEIAWHELRRPERVI